MNEGIYKGAYGGYYFVKETTVDEYGVYTCTSEGEAERPFVIMGENRIEDSYPTKQAALDALSAYAEEWDHKPLSEDERADFYALFDVPPEDEAEDTEVIADSDELEDPELRESFRGVGDNQLTEEEESETPEEVTGDKLSLRNHEFAEIMDTADAALNRLISKLHAKGQQDGEMTVKVSFEQTDDGYFQFSGSVSGKINDTIKPQKIYGQEVEIQFDALGVPVIPVDRQKQMTFDDPEVGGVTVTTDASGIVEKVELVAKAEAIPPECGENECPYYAANDEGVSGCGIKFDDDLSLESDYYDVCRAVEDFSCSRPKVIAAYEIFGNQEMAQENQVEIEESGYDPLEDGGNIA